MDEKARWVFPTITSGFHTLARSISQPGYLLKLCGTPRQLLDALPSGWKLHEPGYFMRTVSKPPEGALADGYTIEINRNGPVITATIFAASGEQAASGYAAETPDAFVYDRIVTEAGHRRRGLASFLIGALHDARSHRETPQFLVATAQGHLLYAALGWELLSPYSTASIAAV